MSRARLYILILGPLPIVAACLLVSDWLRGGPRTTASSNEVVLSGARMAIGAEVNTRRPGRSLDKPCQETADRLTKSLGDGCKVLSRPPFVIAGDMTEAELDLWHVRTISPAAEAMANSYFRTAPTQPITVLLFQSEASYNRYAKDLYGDNAISVYGYYKPHLRTLVMNISTGGGTLVHELTHALMDFDFPDVPDWFNEGLASLHEQCTFRSGDDGPWIEGLTNWRLAGLQSTIRKKRLRPLKTMIEANDFRGELEGTNYAQARYFCLYLQQKDLLRDFYRKFRAAAPKDTLGVQTASRLFPDLTWQELDADFQNWVMALKYE